MTDAITLDSLWAGTPAGHRTFDGGAGFPEPVRRYFSHAIAPGARLANAVRLKMHGEIRLGRWRRFDAEQVISRTRGTMWAARTRLFGLPVHGFDRLVDGRGEMRWNISGLVPMSTGSGDDIVRSAVGRFAGESMWLPPMLLDATLTGDTRRPAHITATWDIHGHQVPVTLTIRTSGAAQQTAMRRWGNPNQEPFAERPFGGVVEEERTFGAYTIPSRVRAGWYFGTDRFDRDGEFFRCTIDDAEFK